MLLQRTGITFTEGEKNLDEPENKRTNEEQFWVVEELWNRREKAHRREVLRNNKDEEEDEMVQN